MTAVRYVTLCAQVVGNPETGFEVAHHWDGRYFADKAAAISNGFSIRDSDDFNVGVIEKGALASMWWMDHQIDETPESLREIAAECGIR